MAGDDDESKAQVAAVGSSNEEENTKVHLSVKTTKETHNIEVDKTSTVEQCKNVIGDKLNTPVEQLCLIFSGKILKDHETLAELGISDGKAIHLVIRAAKQAQQTTSPATGESSGRGSEAAAGATATTGSTRPSTATPTAVSATAAATGAAPFGNPAQLMQNPEMMRQMMDSPMMQALMNNPDVMRTLLMNNPQMQQLIERNPEVGHIMNDPEIMRQSMELMRNPNMFNEMMRHHDRAIQNLQGMPGGEAALQRLYTDYQEPLFNSAQSQFGPENPFATLAANNAAAAGSTSANAGRENTEALPNPWGGRPPPAAGTPRVSSVGPGAGSVGGLMDGAQMEAVMGLLRDNPQLAQQMVANNPLTTTTGNSALQQQLRDAVPHLLERLALAALNNSPVNVFQMNDPSTAAALSNPRVVHAMIQIQQAMEVLRREAPSLVPGFVPPPTTSADTTPAVNSGVNQPTTAPNVQQRQADLMANMIRQLAANELTNNQQPPEERYRSQLEQLSSMGFTNQQANIQALTITFGDVNAAIDRLLSLPVQPPPPTNPGQ